MRTILALICVVIIFAGLLTIHTTLEGEKRAKLYADETTPMVEIPTTTTGNGPAIYVWGSVVCSTVCTMTTWSGANTAAVSPCTVFATTTAVTTTDGSPH